VKLAKEGGATRMVEAAVGKSLEIYLGMWEILSTGIGSVLEALSP